MAQTLADIINARKAEIKSTLQSKLAPVTLIQTPKQIAPAPIKAGVSL
jgi:hypothetical protein